VEALGGIIESYAAKDIAVVDCYNRVSGPGEAMVTVNYTELWDPDYDGRNPKFTDAPSSSAVLAYVQFSETDVHRVFSETNPVSLYQGTHLLSTAHIALHQRLRAPRLATLGLGVSFAYARHEPC
jgi:hypothetical protein